MTATRYSKVAPKPADTIPPVAMLPLLDAQTCLVEAMEELVRFNSIEFDQVDSRLADAMRKIASARSVVQELKRKKLGLVTIAEVG